MHQFIADFAGWNTAGSTDDAWGTVGAFERGEHATRAKSQKNRPTATDAICACAALWPGPAESATLTDETACLQVLEAASRFLSGYLIGKLSDTTGLFVRAVIVQLVRTCNTSTPEKVHLSACDKGAARAKFLTAIARVGTFDQKWRISGGA